MKSKKQHESQELSAQELSDIAGGAAESPQGGYSADSLYDAKEAISKQISDKTSGYYNKSWSYSSEENESSGGESPS